MMYDVMGDRGMKKRLDGMHTREIKHGLTHIMSDEAMVGWDAYQRD